MTCPCLPGMISDFGDIGIVVIHLSTLLPKDIHDIKGGGLAVIRDVRLVGETDDQDPNSLNRKGDRIESLDQVTDHVEGHSTVDLSCKLDETGVEIELACFPREVVGIKRNAVTANPWARIKGHEAEGLGLGGIDHLPDVDPHRCVDPLEFVHEGDVDETEDIFGEFHSLGGVAATDGDHLADGAGVEFDGSLLTPRSESAHDFWHFLENALLVTRILAFRGKGQGEINAGLKPGFGLQNLTEILPGGSRVGAGFEGDKHPFPEHGGNLFPSGEDEGDIGIKVRAKRGGDTDDDRFALGEFLFVAREGQEVFFRQHIDPLGGDGRQRGVSRLKFFHARLIKVESDGAASCFGKTDGQRDADISQADDGDFIACICGFNDHGLLGLDLLGEG